MFTYCPVDTAETERLREKYNAKHPDNQLKLSLLSSYIGIYQFNNKTEDYPSVLELENLIKELNSDEVITAIPIYNNGEEILLKHPDSIYIRSANSINTNTSSQNDIDFIQSWKGYFEGSASIYDIMPNMSDEVFNTMQDIILGGRTPSASKVKEAVDYIKEHKPEDITYTPKGKKKQSYRVYDDGTITNKDGKVVFKNDSVDRNKILTNVAFKKGKAIKISYKDKEYVVYKDGKIVSVTTGKTMQWGEENEDRKAIINIANSKFPSTNTPITPAFSGQMYYDYGNQRAEGVTATNTIDAIKRGERTATTRYTYQRNINYWKKAKVGDVIRFHNNKEGKEKKEVFVRVTKALHKLPKTTTAEEWSKKEGWDTSRFEQKAKPQIEQGDAYQMEFEYIGDDTTSNTSNNPTIITKYFDRREAANDTETLYIFTDNTDRDSGSNLIDPNSPYAKKYGKDKHYPTRTQAVLRGLPNAMPISTQRWYHGNKKGVNGNWHDKDFNEFKKVIDKEIEDIKKEFSTGKYKRIAIGTGDVFLNGAISNITKERTPKLATYLEQKLKEIGINISQENTISTPTIDYSKVKLIDTNVLTGRISLYELIGNTEKEKMDFFYNWLNYMYNNSSLKDTLDKVFTINKDIKSFDDIRKLIDTPRNAYAFLLYGAQAKILFNNSNLKQDEMGVQSINMAFTKVKKFKALKNKKNTQEVNPAQRVIPTQQVNIKQDNNTPPKMGFQNHVTVRETRSSKLRKVFTPEVRRDRVSHLSSVFIKLANRVLEEQKTELSNRLTEVEQSDLNSYEKTKKIRDLKTAQSELNDSKKGTLYAINNAGVPIVLARLRKIYESYISKTIEENIEKERKGNYGKIVIKRQEGDYEKNLRNYVEHKRAEYQKIVEYFNDLIIEAFPEIESKSGISLNEEIAFEANNIDIDDNGTPIIDTDTETGQKYKDGWMTRARYINPISTLSKRIKVALSAIPIKNPKGKLIFDDLGNPKYMNPAQVYTILLTESHKIMDVDQFSTKENPVLFFERLKSKYTWAKDVIRALSNSDGSYNMPLVSEMYTCLRMQFVPYFYSRDEFIQAANIESGFEGIMSKTRTNIERGYRLNKSQSLYTQDGKIDKDNIPVLLQLCKDLDYDLNSSASIIELLNHENTKEEADKEIKKIANNFSKLVKAIGFEFEKEDAERLLLDTERRDDFYNYSFNGIYTLLKGIGKYTEAYEIIDRYKNVYSNLAYTLEIVGQEALKTSFFNGGKQKYSYSYPNYVHKVVTHLSQEAYNTRSTKPEYSSIFHQTIEEEFKRDSIFFRDERFYNKWLQMLTTDSEVRKKFTHIQMDSIDGKDYADWTTEDIYKMFNNAYVNGNESSTLTKHQYAYYHLPIFADSPAMIMVRAPKFIGYNYKETIIEALVDVVLTEMHRIDRVRKRAEKIKNGELSPITNYDMIINKETGEIEKIGGAEFKFFPDLNTYMMDAKRSFNDVMEEYLKNQDMDSVRKDITKALTDIMQKGYEKFEMEEESSYFEDAENYYYNSVLATTQIIQLMTSDLAFYKNAIDFQKRFKEVYAAGKRFNTNSELGKKIRRAAYLRDQILPSRSIYEIRNALSKNTNLDKNAIDYIISKFNRINVTDAQAYLSPKAYEQMLDMLGQLTPEVKAAFERFRESAELVKQGKSPTWTAADFQIVWQTFKPFMYTQVHHPTGIDNNFIKTPLQHKNSEIMISTLFNLVAGPYSNSAKLNAISKFMEEHNIDVFMFESAVKVGGHDFIDLNYSPSRLKAILSKESVSIGKVEVSTTDKEGKAKTFEDFVDEAAKLRDNNKITNSEYKEFLDSFEPTEAEVTKMLEAHFLNAKDKTLDTSRCDDFSYEDVMIAQENPEHLMDNKKATFGSQFANLIFSDFNPNNPIRLSNGDTMTSRDAKNLYNSLRVENIIESFKECREKIATKKSLSEFLIRTINSNPAYNKDLANALELVTYRNSKGEEVEDFNFPLHTPAMSKKLNQVALAIFKNTITKQYINGGNAVLVSDFGLTDSLEIEYDDNGNLLGIQCYLPAYSKELFAPLMDKNGYLDINKLHETGLDKAIGYRIPTEGKYSMVPLIIKGFLPQQNGSVIMLPSDITTLAGSDFDIDKMFLMLNNFYIYETIDKKAFRKAAIERFGDNLKKWDRGQISAKNEGKATDRLNTFFDRLANKEEFEKGSIEEALSKFYFDNKDLFTTYKAKKVKYDLEQKPEEQSKEARDNMIIDLAFGALTSPEGAAQMSMPGNFDNVAHAASLNRVVKSAELIKEVIDATSPELSKKFEENSLEREDYISIAEILLKTDPKVLKKLADKQKNSIKTIEPTTFVMFHKASTIGGKMIGIYANSNTHFAKTQNSGLSSFKDITLFERSGTSLDEVYDDNGKLISYTSAEYSAASVDDAKEHNLEPLNQNEETAPITALLVRRKYSPIDIGIYLGNSNYTYTNPRAKITAKISKELLLADTISQTISESNGILTTEEISTLSKINAIIQTAAKGLNHHIMINRADSPNGGISNTNGAAAMQIIRREMLPKSVDKVLVYNKENMLTTGQVANNIDNINTIRELCMRSKTPMVAAFRALGIDAVEHLMKPYMIGFSDNLMEILRFQTINSSYLNLSDKVAEDIISHYVIYRLSETRLFGDDNISGITMEQKRDDILNKFPDQLNKFLKNPKYEEYIKNNLFLKNIVINKYGEICIPSPNNFNIDTVEKIKSSAIDLFFNDDLTLQLAYKLMLYSYYKDGLQFKSNSITPYITTTDYMSQFPELVTCLRNMSLKEPSYIASAKTSEFTDQLIRNIGVSHIAYTIKTSPTSKNKLPNGIYQNGKDAIYVNAKESYGVVNKANNAVPYIQIQRDQIVNTVVEWYTLTNIRRDKEGRIESAYYTKIDSSMSYSPIYKVGGGGDYFLKLQIEESKRKAPKNPGKDNNKNSREAPSIDDMQEDNAALNYTSDIEAENQQQAQKLSDLADKAEIPSEDRYDSMYEKYIKDNTIEDAIRQKTEKRINESNEEQNLCIE